MTTSLPLLPQEVREAAARIGAEYGLSSGQSALIVRTALGAIDAPEDPSPLPDLIAALKGLLDHFDIDNLYSAKRLNAARAALARAETRASALPVTRAGRGCAGKIQHRTLDIAKLVADIGNAKKKPLDGPIGAYECPVCAMFHVGHINVDGYGPDGRLTEVQPTSTHREGDNVCR